MTLKFNHSTLLLIIHQNSHISQAFSFSCTLPQRGEGSLGSIVGGSGGPLSCYSCFTWMYLEWACSLVCPPNLWWNQLPGLFSKSGGLTLWFLPCMTASHFPAGNRETNLNPTTFFSLLLFCVFLSFLFSKPPNDIVPLSAAGWSYSLIIIIKVITPPLIPCHLCFSYCN